MGVRDKTDGSRPGAGLHRVQRKIALGTVDNFRLNAVDIAIFAAVFSLIADKSVSNTHSALKRILAESKEENIQNLQLNHSIKATIKFKGNKTKKKLFQ